MKLVMDKVNEGESGKQLFAAGAGRSILYISNIDFKLHILAPYLQHVSPYTHTTFHAKIIFLSCKPVRVSLHFIFTK